MPPKAVAADPVELNRLQWCEQQLQSNELRFGKLDNQMAGLSVQMAEVVSRLKQLEEQAVVGKLPPLTPNPIPTVPMVASISNTQRQQNTLLLEFPPFEIIDIRSWIPRQMNWFGLTETTRIHFFNAASDKVMRDLSNLVPMQFYEIFYAIHFVNCSFWVKRGFVEDYQCSSMKFATMCFDPGIHWLAPERKSGPVVQKHSDCISYSIYLWNAWSNSEGVDPKMHLHSSLPFKLSQTVESKMGKKIMVLVLCIVLSWNYVSNCKPTIEEVKSRCSDAVSANQKPIYTFLRFKGKVDKWVQAHLEGIAKMIWVEFTQADTSSFQFDPGIACTKKFFPLVAAWDCNDFSLERKECVFFLKVEQQIVSFSFVTRLSCTNYLSIETQFALRYIFRLDLVSTFLEKKGALDGEILLQLGLPSSSSAWDLWHIAVLLYFSAVHKHGVNLLFSFSFVVQHTSCPPVGFSNLQDGLNKSVLLSVYASSTARQGQALNSSHEKRVATYFNAIGPKILFRLHPLPVLHDLLQGFLSVTFKCCSMHYYFPIFSWQLKTKGTVYAKLYKDKTFVIIDRFFLVSQGSMMLTSVQDKMTDSSQSILMLLGVFLKREKMSTVIVWDPIMLQFLWRLLLSLGMPARRFEPADPKAEKEQWQSLTRFTREVTILLNLRKQLGIHDKPVGFLNADGCYNYVLPFIDKAVYGFIKPSQRSIIVLAPNVAALVQKLEE